MKPFDVAVTLGMVVGRAAVGDAQLVQGFDITRRGKLRVVGRQSQTHSPRTERAGGHCLVQSDTGHHILSSS